MKLNKVQLPQLNALLTFENGGLAMVKKRTLLFLAALVWLAAGVNIMRIGVIAYSGHLTLLAAVGSVVVFVLFWRMFRGLVGKHTGRIHDFAEERQFFWRFFDARSFAIMAVMMTGGITIRVMHLAPDAFIAIFYTGLGTALALAGLAFGCQFFRYKEQG